MRYSDMPKRSRTAKPHKPTLKALIKKPRRVITKAHRQEQAENEEQQRLKKGAH
jgi:hypothetical protein